MSIGGFQPPPGNPYAAPGFGDLGAARPGAPSPGAPQAPDAMEALRCAWRHVAADPVGTAAPILVALFVAGIPGGIVQFARSLLQAGLQRSDLDPMVVGVILLGTMIAGQFVSALGTAAMMAGISRFALRVVRGERPEFGVVFSGFDSFVTMYASALLLQLAVALGLMACAVPGIMVALGLSQYAFVHVDRGTGAIDSLKGSWALTDGYKLNLLVIAVLMFAVTVGGLLACCVGVFVAVVLQFLVQAYAYEALSGRTPVTPA